MINIKLIALFVYWWYYSSMKYLYYVILAIISYFIGNISSGRIVSKLYKDDITKYGSGNPGTANMCRNFGIGAGALTLFLDALKGATPCLIGRFLFCKLGCNPYIALYVAALFVVVGNIFPVIYKFKGGKGIATGVGAITVSHWYVGLPAILLAIILTIITKYASVANLTVAVGVIVAEICLCNPTNWPIYIFASLILVLLFFAHRKNIARLFNGTEKPLDLGKNIKNLFKKNKEDKENKDGEENK